ncbi:hypothetical protein QG516_20830 [Pedobacter gandavensis]|uniref:hypothetical protein n=1 Tax=Pedobacter gandavensis TaxID=2679963 RepID=UPI00247A09E9|nr:hypothetical protein [Pedobacter gandavensis]WGQ08961.1 hypothetical protein QG516_20830 [Pedobacter gandavensis]
MEMQQLPPKGLDFFRLPLEKGTVILSLETLNAHSSFRRTRKPFLHITQRKVSYAIEILTIGITLDHEKEELVYVQVKPTELLVGCSVDTSESYLSRYVYYALQNLMNYNGECDFKEFYWPDFFHTKTGKSKYLNIINDRWGMTVGLKEQYSHFYKPETKLVDPFREAICPARLKRFPFTQKNISASNCVIGYCFADTTFVPYRSNHYPFLIPYLGKLNKNQETIKSYQYFIKGVEASAEPQYSPVQIQLHALLVKMKVLAPTQNTQFSHSKTEKQEIRNHNMERRDQLFYLWQEAYPMLESQSYTHYFMTYGMKNLETKPFKKYLIPCVFAREIPKIYFLWQDKGDYYDLKMRFRIGNKTMVPGAENPVFFLRSTKEPMVFYLLGTLADYQLSAFFEVRNFSICVLKTHFNVQFQDFITKLERMYQFQKSTHKELSN